MGIEYFSKKDFLMFFLWWMIIVPFYILSCYFGGISTNILLVFVVFYIYHLALRSTNGLYIVMVVFMSTYLIYLVPYFFYGYGYATRQDYQDPGVAIVSFHLIVLFVFIFLTSTYFSLKKDFLFDMRLVNMKEPLLYYICLFVLVFFVLLSVNLKGTAITSSYQEVTEERYAFIDYAIIFVLLGFVFSHSERARKILLWVAFLYVFISLVNGLRLRSIQMMILLFALYYERRFNPKFVFASAFVGLVFMQVWGELRIGDNAFLSRDYVIVSNQGGVFLNANMYIGLVGDGYITGWQRFSTFIGNFLAIGYSQGDLPIDFNLAALASSYFSIPGGGLISGYLYVWGGWFGVFFGAIIIAAIYGRSVSSSASQVMLIYSVVILATMPRWFAYNPIHFFKMGGWAVMLYLVFLFYYKIRNGYAKF